jgi:ankyrin repeat protein
VNLCGTNGYTPLHLACRNGNIDVVNSLLKCNSSVNICGTNGYTPLHTACIKGMKPGEKNIQYNKTNNT